MVPKETDPTQLAGDLSRTLSTLEIRRELGSIPGQADEVAAQIISDFGSIADSEIPDAKSDLQRYSYKTMLAIIPLVDESTATALFKLYPLVDVKQSFDDATSSGYEPVVEMLLDREISEELKLRALSTWIKFAKKQQKPDSSPRQPYESATQNLAGFVEICAERREPVGNQIIIDIVNFLESEAPSIDNGDPVQAYVRPSLTGAIATYLVADADSPDIEKARVTEIRQRFILRHAIQQTSPEKFDVLTHEDAMVFQELRQMYHSREGSRLMLGAAITNRTPSSKLLAEIFNPNPDAN
jgi:hypothetical protein